MESCPYVVEVNALKNGIIAELKEEGLHLGGQQGDREDVPIDFWFLGLLLKAAEDPEEAGSPDVLPGHLGSRWRWWRRTGRGSLRKIERQHSSSRHLKHSQYWWHSSFSSEGLQGEVGLMSRSRQLSQTIAGTEQR